MSNCTDPWPDVASVETGAVRGPSRAGDGAAADVGRNLSMDRLRGLAILMVLAYHGFQMAPQPAPLLASAAHYGQYGVDLFFVLSGWLIGALFWREWRRFGNVALGRFWLRRSLRTLPPYMGALAVSWLTVRFVRGEPFDYGYLAFVQNYYARMPFFLVSWSLCVEEHFYLFAPPLALLLATRLPGRGMAAVALLLATSGLVFRLIESGRSGSGFGYATTATHLRLDGLVMGFAASCAFDSAPAAYARAVGVLWRFAPVFLVLAATVEHIGGGVRYVALPFLVAVLGVIVVARASLPGRRQQRAGAVDHWLQPVARAAFSIYLTHALALHLAVSLSTRPDRSSAVVYWVAVGALVPLLAGCAYFALERPSILLRDRYFPRREASAAP